MEVLFVGCAVLRVALAFGLLWVIQRHARLWLTHRTHSLGHGMAGEPAPPMTRRLSWLQYAMLGAMLAVGFVMVFWAGVSLALPVEWQVAYVVMAGASGFALPPYDPDIFALPLRRMSLFLAVGMLLYVAFM